MARAVGADIVFPPVTKNILQRANGLIDTSLGRRPRKRRDFLSPGLKARLITPTEIGRTLVNLLPFVECPTGIVRTAPLRSQERIRKGTQAFHRLLAKDIQKRQLTEIAV